MKRSTNQMIAFIQLFGAWPQNVWQFKLQIIHVLEHVLRWVLRSYIYFPRSRIHLAEIKLCLRRLPRTNIKFSFGTALSFGAITKYPDACDKNWRQTNLTSTCFEWACHGKNCTEINVLYSGNFAFFFFEHVTKKLVNIWNNFLFPNMIFAFSTH